MLLVPRHSGPAASGLFSLARDEPAGSKKIFEKVEDCQLTASRDALRCSSRTTGSDSKSDVLPFWLTGEPIV